MILIKINKMKMNFFFDTFFSIIIIELINADLHFLFTVFVYYLSRLNNKLVTL